MCGRAVPSSPLGARLHRISPQRSVPSCFLPIYHPVRPSTVPVAILKIISTSPSPCPHPLLSCPIHTPPQPPALSWIRDKTEGVSAGEKKEVCSIQKGGRVNNLGVLQLFTLIRKYGSLCQRLLYTFCVTDRIYIGYMNNNTDDKDEITLYR